MQNTTTFTLLLNKLQQNQKQTLTWFTAYKNFISVFFNSQNTCYDIPKIIICLTNFSQELWLRSHNNATQRTYEFLHRTTNFKCEEIYKFNDNKDTVYTSYM